MTVKERVAGIVGDDVELQLLESTQHHDVLDDAGGRFARYAPQFEAVPVQVQRMDVVARVF